MFTVICYATAFHLFTFTLMPAFRRREAAAWHAPFCGVTFTPTEVAEGKHKSTLARLRKKHPRLAAPAPSKFATVRVDPQGRPWWLCPCCKTVYTLGLKPADDRPGPVTTRSESPRQNAATIFNMLCPLCL